MEMTATAEELLAVVEDLFPREFDRSRAELTIRKQAARIAELEQATENHQHSHQGDE
jgi:hypothetical protein